MKSTVIIRNIDDLGRVVLPCKLRRTLNISNGDPIDICSEGNRIIIKKHETGCVFTGDFDDLIEYHGMKVSRTAAYELAAIAGIPNAG